MALPTSHDVAAALRDRGMELCLLTASAIVARVGERPRERHTVGVFVRPDLPWVIRHIREPGTEERRVDVEIHPDQVLDAIAELNLSPAGAE